MEAVLSTCGCLLRGSVEMVQNLQNKLRKVWLKLLKAEVKHKRKKVKKLEQKLIKLELEQQDN